MNDTIEQDDSSFNDQFCIFLAYHLGKAFELSGREDLRGFWCDGVSAHPFVENQLSKKSVNDKRKILTEAGIGKTGQDKYEMTILFGKYSLRRYAKGSSLADCVPVAETMEWIDINTINRTISIQLI